METHHSPPQKKTISRPNLTHDPSFFFSLSFIIIIIIMTVLSRFANKVVIVTGNPYLDNVDMV